MYKSIVFLLTTLFSSISIANNLTVDCDYCSTDIEFREKAKSSAGNDNNIIYVTNIITGTIKKYNIFYSAPETGMPARYRINEIVIDSESLNTFNNIVLKRREIEDFLGTYNYVPENLATSAYDLVAKSYIQNAISDNYVKNQTFQQLIGNYTGLVTAFLGKIVGANFVIEFSFKDGSSALFSFKTLDSSGNLEFQLLSANDADGNDIPLNVSKVPGSYSFNRQGASGTNNFMNALRLLGVRIEINGFSTSGPGGRVDCYNTGSNKLTCTYHKE